MKINDKARNILIFMSAFTVIYMIMVCCFYLYDMSSSIDDGQIRYILSDYQKKEIIYNRANSNLLFYLRSFIYALLHYLPTIFLLKFIFRKVIDTNKQIWCIAFALPLTNLIYCITHLYIQNLSIYNPDLWYKLWYTKIYMHTIGESEWIYIILLLMSLITVLTALITPKKYLPIKKEISKTAILTFVVSVFPFLLMILLAIILKLINML